MAKLYDGLNFVRVHFLLFALNAIRAEIQYHRRECLYWLAIFEERKTWALSLSLVSRVSLSVSSVWGHTLFSRSQRTLHKHRKGAELWTLNGSTVYIPEKSIGARSRNRVALRKSIPLSHRGTFPSAFLRFVRRISSTDCHGPDGAVSDVYENRRWYSRRILRVCKMNRRYILFIKYRFKENLKNFF